MIQTEINHAASFKEKPATATAPAIRIVGPMPTTDNKPKLLTQLSQAIRSRHYSRALKPLMFTGSNDSSFSIMFAIRKKWPNRKSMLF
ncbi:MAG: hypothetical protein WA124_02750 [Smithella sp.]